MRKLHFGALQTRIWRITIDSSSLWLITAEPVRRKGEGLKLPVKNKHQKKELFTAEKFQYLLDCSGKCWIFSLSLFFLPQKVLTAERGWLLSHQKIFQIIQSDISTNISKIWAHILNIPIKLVSCAECQLSSGVSTASFAAECSCCCPLATPPSRDEQLALVSQTNQDDLNLEVGILHEFAMDRIFPLSLSKVQH